MAEQRDHSPDSPHILIVNNSTKFRGRLKQILKGAGISSEGATDAGSALKKLDRADPPITGVLTDALRGDFRPVIDAARQIGANVVLMTQSSITRSQMQDEGIASYLQSTLIGSYPEQGTIDSMLAELVPTVSPLGEEL